MDTDLVHDPPAAWTIPALEDLNPVGERQLRETVLGTRHGPMEREFRHYLSCAIRAYGSARARRAACGHDSSAVAFACKGRGLRPSCTTRRMAETAAHVVDHAFPPWPVRQWALAVPKRLPWCLEPEPRALSGVVHFLLRVIERHLAPTAVRHLRVAVPTVQRRAAPDRLRHRR